VTIRIVSAVVVTLTLSNPTLARQPDAFDSCAQNKDSTARLACFDREVAARDAADKASARTGDGSPAAAAVSTKAPTIASARATATAPQAMTATSAATISGGASSTDAAAKDSSSNRDIGLDALELRRQRAQRGEADPTGLAPIEAMIVRVIRRQPMISAFELDNGQVWEQSESMKITTRPDQKITNSHGVLGAFFLKTADGTVVVRVHRLR
jgi:hypothetical protein